MLENLLISTNGSGLIDITSLVDDVVARNSKGIGLCTLFIRHTSCSLLIQENADPSAKRDLENWLNRLVPEGDPLYTHIYEGPDDIPAHIKSMLTQSSLSIPIENGDLTLGTWQGIFLFEHRMGAHERNVVVHVLNDE